MAHAQGIEPWFADLEAAVLPLHYAHKTNWWVHKVTLLGRTVKSRLLFY